MNISLLRSPISIPALARLPSAPSVSGSFGEALGSAIGAVESAGASAKTAAGDLLIGGKGDVHNVALATQRAELSLELFQQVRNKFVQAYQEVMKMPM